MSKIQDFFIGELKHIDIPPGEYEGPLVIKHSCIVDGHGTTLWSKNNAALVVNAPNVTIKNFRVELMRKTRDFIAIEILHKDARLENIEVYGNIRGLDSASENWNLPRTIDFGNFAAGSQNEFSRRFNIGESCHVNNSIYGLNISPQNLSPGEFDLCFTVSPMKDGTILYGSFCLETANKILRRIYVSGRAQNGAEIKRVLKVPFLPLTSQAHVPQNPKQTQTDTKKFFPVLNFPQQKKTNRVTCSNSTSQQPQTNTGKVFLGSNKVKKGQKIFAPNSENIRVAFTASNLSNDITIDACAFCLGKNKKVQRDTDFIFFNNPRHESLGVSLDSKENTPGIGLNLKKIPDEIQSVVIYFSIYDEGNRFENNFSNLYSPKVIVFADENVLYEFSLQLDKEKIFKALEIYRDKSDWKIYFIGLSSEKDFAKLCEYYGVEVL